MLDSVAIVVSYHNVLENFVVNLLDLECHLKFITLLRIFVLNPDAVAKTFHLRLAQVHKLMLILIIE